MNAQYGAKRTIVRASHTMYVASLAIFLYNLDMSYVTKMRYNKDKDLVFVQRPTRLWGEEEHVYEVHHLEQMVPMPVTAIPNMSSLDKNGIYTVKCMAKNENLKLYKDDKYWNTDLREEFYRETNGLWRNGLHNKHNGTIFSTGGPAEKDWALAMDKIDREMDAAVEKHGRVTLPRNSHIDDFYETIDRNKENIARA